MTRTTATAILGTLAALFVGCVSEQPNTLGGDQAPAAQSDTNPTEQIPEQPGAYAGGEDNTFDHMSGLGADGARDPFEVLSQREEEGPLEVRTRMHSCQKIQYFALKQILQGLGVDMAATGNPPTAGQLFSDGTSALGAANYDARVGETIVWTAAGAAKVFDIFVQAAPEIIANLPNAPLCQIDGAAGPALFDAENHCNEDAITCLIGRPAREEHIAICEALVKGASDPEKGKQIAVAALLSAAHSCE